MSMANPKELFQKALVDLKSHIERIGNKKFSLSRKGEWPLNNTSLALEENDLYRINAFQALWNITDTLERASSSTFVTQGQITILLPNESLMTAWFDYLEPKKGNEIRPEDGTLRILDDSTYELGQHLYEFFKLAIANKHTNELLTQRGITPFKRINDTLKIRLDTYAAKGALAAYADKINNALAVEETLLPDVLYVTDDGKLAYHIDLVAIDTPDFVNVNVQAYVSLLSELRTYASSIMNKSKEIEHQIKGFNAAHALPREATPNTKEAFVAIRDTAKAKLHTIQEHLHVQHEKVNGLIAEVKAKCLFLNDQGQQGVLEEQKEKLQALQAIIDERKAIAEASLKAYQTKKQTVTASNAAPMLDSSQNHHNILNIALVELNKLQEGIKSTFKKSTSLKLPSAEILINIFGYTNEKDKSIVTELHKKIHDISQVRFVTKSKEHASVISNLQARIKLKLKDIQEKPKAAISTLALAEHQSRQDALALRQAQLNLHLTNLEFRLDAIAPQERSLEILMHQINSMLASDALERIAADKDSVSQLKAWFKATTDAQPTSSLDLYETIQGSIAAQDQDRVNIELLRVNSGLSVQASLDNEHKVLAEKSKKIVVRYLALKEAIQAFDVKEKSLQDNSLQTTIACCVAILQKIETQEAWTSEEKQQVLDDIHQQSVMLEKNKAYFANVTDASLEPIYEHQTKLAQAKKTLELKMCTMVSVFLTPEEQLYELKNTYFGISGVKGIFPAYLEERHKTFWFRDFIGQVAAVLFGCFSYKTTVSIRTAYIASLESCMNNYKDEPQSAEKLETLNQWVDKGLKDFKPRTWKPQEYAKSLHAKLTSLKNELSGVKQVKVLTAADDGILPESPALEM